MGEWQLAELRCHACRGDHDQRIYWGSLPHRHLHWPGLLSAPAAHGVRQVPGVLPQIVLVASIVMAAVCHLYVVSMVTAICYDVCQADRSGRLLLLERGECCRYNAKHTLLMQFLLNTVLSTGCLTNFLPFTMARDQMAVTLDKHMALRTEVAVLTQRHLQYHKVPDITHASVNAKVINTVKQSCFILPMHNHATLNAAETSCRHKL